jgi:hypothetical protein
MPLGRREPTDWVHVQKYALTTETVPDKPTPVVAGTNWYSSFDRPQWDERGKFWMVGHDHRTLGHVRGGHAYVFKPSGVVDPTAWWTFFNQGREGACVGFAISRAMALLNRRRYDARWLYREAQLIDEWTSTPPEEGTSVRAGLDVVRERGHRRVFRGRINDCDPAEGIERNRWATGIDDMAAALRSPRYLKIGRMPFLNSWGRGYPHIVWMPLDTIDRLRREHGELAIITDK